MDLRSNYSRLATLQAKDNEQVWQECYTEDIVRRISGLDPMVGRDACQRQVQEFIDGLKGPLKQDQTALARRAGDRYADGPQHEVNDRDCGTERPAVELEFLIHVAMSPLRAPPVLLRKSIHARKGATCRRGSGRAAP